MFKKLIALLFLALSFSVGAMEHKHDHHFAIRVNVDEDPQVKQLEIEFLINEKAHTISVEGWEDRHIYTFPLDVINLREPTSIEVLSFKYFHVGTNKYYEHVLNNSSSCKVNKSYAHEKLHHETITTLPIDIGSCGVVGIRAIHE